MEAAAKREAEAAAAAEAARREAEEKAKREAEEEVFIVKGRLAAAAAAAPEEVTAEDLEAGLPEVEAWRRRAQPQESAAALGTRIVTAFDKLRASAPTGAATAAEAGGAGLPEIDDDTVAAALAALEEGAGWSATELALARRVLTGDAAADDDAPAPAPAPCRRGPRRVLA